jgi:hypothetical protein
LRASVGDGGALARAAADAERELKLQQLQLQQLQHQKSQEAAAMAEEAQWQQQQQQKLDDMAARLKEGLVLNRAHDGGGGAAAEQYECLFDFNPSQPDEIPLSVGTPVQVLERPGDGWVKVRTSDGQ